MINIDSIRLKLTHTPFMLKERSLLRSIITLAFINLKIRYRKSILGLAWTFVTPLFYVGIYFFLFHTLFQVIEEKELFTLITMIFPWFFLSNTIQQGVHVLLGHRDIHKSLAIPLFVFPLVTTVANFFHLIISLTLVFILSLFFDFTFTVNFAGLLHLLLLFTMVFFLTLFVACSYIFFRDLAYLIPPIFNILFYSVPILYTLEKVPEKYHFLTYLNPLFYLFHNLKRSFLNSEYNLLNLSTGITLIWIFAFLFIAYTLFNKESKNLIEYL